MGNIIAPIAGAVLGGMASRPRGSTTSVQTAEPWSGVQPALSSLYSSALQNFQGQAPQYYPGSTVAGQSSDTLRAQDLLRRRAMSGSPLVGAAQNQAARTLRGEFLNTPATRELTALGGSNFGLTAPGTEGLQSTAQGDFLNANPYLDRMFDQASSRVGEQFQKNVMPGVASMFASGGRYGSNAMQESMGQAQDNFGDTLNNLATNIYGGNYANERGMQQAAQGTLGQLGLAGRSQQIGALGELGSQFQRERLLQAQTMGQAPGLAQADYFDIGQLANVGGARDAYSQAGIDADRARWDFNQNQGRDQLAFLNSILQGAPMGNSTTQSGGQYSPLGGLAGGAMLGQSIFNGMQSKPASGSGFAGGLFGAGTNPYSGEFMGSLEF